MKTITQIILIIVGLLLYVAGIAHGGNGIAMLVSLLGGIIMVCGLFPTIDKTTFAKVKK